MPPTDEDDVRLVAWMGVQGEQAHRFGRPDASGQAHQAVDVSHQRSLVQRRRTWTPRSTRVS